MRKMVLSILFTSCLCMSAQLWGQSAPGILSDGKKPQGPPPMPDLQGMLGFTLGKYYKAVGGEEGLNTLNSLKMQGVFSLEDKEYAFTIWKKKPNHIKRVFRTKEWDWVMAYNGDVVWSLFTSSNGKRFSFVEGPESKDFVRDAQFVSHLFYPTAPGKELRFIESLEEDGIECKKIEVVLPDGHTMVYYLNADTGLEHKVVHEIWLDDKQVDQEAYYSDFKPVLGFPIPHRVDFHIGGALHSSMIINNIKANEGVVSWMFEPPPEAKESAVKSSD